MYRGTAFAGVTRASPGVDGQAHSALDRTLAGIAAWMPVLLPLHQLGGLLQLSAIRVGSRSVAEVLDPHVEWIHVDLRGEILERSRGDEARLWMVGRAPSSRAACVARNSRVVHAAVRNVVEDVRVDLRVNASAANPARGPTLRVPGRDGAVLLPGYFHFREYRGTIAGDAQF